jgi:DNA invertase Pin-like site-specific DNA recombinase
MKLTDKKIKRLERNERIIAAYNSELSKCGMKSVIIDDIAKEFNLTVPTVYNILRDAKG